MNGKRTGRRSSKTSAGGRNSSKLVREAEEEAKKGGTELRVGRANRWSEWCAEQSSKGGGKLYKWIRDGSKAFVLPRCDPDWKGTKSQQAENPPPGLASKQAGIEKAW
eukprot:5746814-Heterocapsa_arctica.AAC.2